MSINRFSFALTAAENERYLVRKGVDMLAVLKALVARNEPMSLYFGETDDRIETQLLSINPAYEELIFSSGVDPAAIERLLTAGSFGVETLLDSIRILFIATHAEVSLFKGQKALRARIPDRLARMQRREALRVPMSKDKPSFCDVRLSKEPLHVLRLQVNDISISGLSLILPASETALPPGKTFSECSLDLPGIGMMRCTLNIVHSVEAETTGQHKRIGCHFVDLPALSREQVRSHVARLERAYLASG